MRPGQNKRMRGRNNNNNNNRKGPNPLTRSYESNGPDVKIRGTAQHVAEKYLQLARDAQSSGDPVMAESYLQHAEHYFRIIAAAQQAQQQQQAGYSRQPNEGPSESDDSGDDDEGHDMNDRFAAPAERAQALLNQPQPNFPQQGSFGGQNREGGREGGRDDRNQQDHQGQRNNNQRRRPQFENQNEQPAQAINNDEDNNSPPGLPSFITGANRAPERTDSDGDNTDAGRNQMRNRRRRRPMPQDSNESRTDAQADRSEPEVPAGE